jgi:hypothetical protein
MLGWLAGRRAGGVWVGAFAGLVFLALGFPRDPDDAPWLGLYRVDMLGLALSVASICLLTWRGGRPAVVGAGVLAGLAILSKQTFVAALIAGGLWLAFARPKAPCPSMLFWFVGPAVLTVAIPCVVLEAATGAFLQNTVEANVNPFYVVVAVGLLSVFVRTQWLPILLAGVYLGLGRPWQTKHSRLLVMYWAASSISLLGIGKIGANNNYWIEFAAATAILAARGAWCVLSISKHRLAALCAAALILSVGVQLGGPPALLASARAIRSDVGSLLASPSDPEFDTLVERVRSEPRTVLAEPMDVLVLGGRPVSFEPFIYSIRMDIGRWQPDGLVARICTGEIGLVVLGYSLEVGTSLTDGLHALWPRPVMAALHHSMALETVTAGRYVYSPRPPPVPISPGIPSRCA